MEQYTLYAYEALGVWQITMGRQVFDQMEPNRHDLIYRATHVPIDEEDPLIRAELILHQVLHDLEAASRGELDILAERPPGH